MGCADSSPNQLKQLSNLNNRNLEKTQKQIKTSAQKQNMQNCIVPCTDTKPKTQDLTLSDYQAFLKKSKQEGRVDYPTSFRHVNILPISDVQLSKCLKEDVVAYRCTRLQLIDLSHQMIMENTFSKSKLNANHIKSLITEIAHNYNSVSYHNFTHGFSLMQVWLVLAQMIYKCFKVDETLRKTYSDEDLTYYLLAGITHDVNHKGTNNLYQVKLKTELAKTAQDDAVLEKMHLSTFLAICKSKPEYDVISKSSNPQATKEKITRAILATDMAKHFKNLQKIKKLRQQHNLNLSNQQVKQQIMQNLIHASDIGNALLPTEQYLTWGSILTYQFNEQTKLQAKNNVPVTEFLRYQGISKFYDDQAGFLRTFVLPLWKEINVSFGGIVKMVGNVDRNIQAVLKLKQQQKS